MRAASAALGLVVAVAAGPARAYEISTTEGGEPLRWWTSCVYWTLVDQSIDNSRFSDPVQAFISAEELRGAVRASFATWDEVSCSYVELIETDPGHCIDVGLHRTAGNANRIMVRPAGWVDPDSPWRVPEQIALTSVFYDTETGEILDVDIEINAEYFELTTVTDGARTDIQNALTHEVGHLLGLDHSARTDATMWRNAGAGEILKRDLADDDVAGVCALYPLEEDPGVCDEPHGGLDLDCETAESCTDAVDGIAGSCWFDELVCCCDRAGGLGSCGWERSPACAQAGRHGVLQIDATSACPGARPGPLHTCCCQMTPSGADCAWLPFSDCEAQAGLPGTAVTAEVLCGPYPEDSDCGCRAVAARPSRLRWALDLLLP